jgi:hypothetical protein
MAAKLPVVVRFLSQKGDSPFKELVRLAKEYLNIDGEPSLWHGDEAGRERPLVDAAGFDHAVRITGPDRYMTIIVDVFKEKCGLPCCCCGRSDAPPKPPASKELEPIVGYTLAPPGLRELIIPPVPFGRWNDPDEPTKPKSGGKPMLKALM